MNLKAICTTILFACSVMLVSAQSKDILAKSAMLNADEAYGNGQYSECLGFLKETETNLGKTNSRIQYLKVKSLMSLGVNDQYNRTIWSQAEAELKTFFEVTSENGYVQEKYDEMVLTVGKIKGKIKEIQEVEEMERIINSPWNRDRKQKWMTAHQNYQRDFPNGTYTKTANENMNKIIWFEKMKSNPDSVLEVELNNYNISAVKACIENGANPNKFYPNHKTGTLWNFFLVLTRFGQRKSFKDTYAFLTFLFEHGADPNIYWDGSDPQASWSFNCRSYPINEYMAYCSDESKDCNQQRIEIVKLFLKYGFKKENLSNGYYNILSDLLVKYKDNWSLIEFLLDAGADPYTGYDKCHSTAYSPMENARKGGRTPKYELIDLFKKYKK